jgi:hypothetical protein
MQNCAEESDSWHNSFCHRALHFIVGNSGGPVLSGMNQVVGVAVKGQGQMGEFTSSDEVSCFLPIEAIKRLKN